MSKFLSHFQVIISRSMNPFSILTVELWHLQSNLKLSLRTYQTIWTEIMHCSSLLFSSSGVSQSDSYLLISLWESSNWITKILSSFSSSAPYLLCAFRHVTLSFFIPFPPVKMEHVNHFHIFLLSQRWLLFSSPHISDTETWAN